MDIRDKQIANIQTEKGEVVWFLGTNHLPQVHAKRTHRAMESSGDGDMVTDSLPEGRSFIFSDHTKIKRQDAKDMVVGIKRYPYSEHKKGKEPELWTLDEVIFKKGDKNKTPAKAAQKVKNKFKTVDCEHPSAIITNAENLAHRQPYLEGIAILAENQREKEEAKEQIGEVELVPLFKKGGKVYNKHVEKAQFGFLKDIGRGIGKGVKAIGNGIKDAALFSLDNATNLAFGADLIPDSAFSYLGNLSNTTGNAFNKVGDVAVPLAATALLGPGAAAAVSGLRGTTNALGDGRNFGQALGSGAGQALGSFLGSRALGNSGGFNNIQGNLGNLTGLFSRQNIGQTAVNTARGRSPLNRLFSGVAGNIQGPRSQLGLPNLGGLGQFGTPGFTGLGGFDLMGLLGGGGAGLGNIFGELRLQDGGVPKAQYGGGIWDDIFGTPITPPFLPPTTDTIPRIPIPPLQDLTRLPIPPVVSNTPAGNPLEDRLGGFMDSILNGTGSLGTLPQVGASVFNYTQGQLPYVNQASGIQDFLGNTVAPIGTGVAGALGAVGNFRTANRIDDAYTAYIDQLPNLSQQQKDALTDGTGILNQGATEANSFLNNGLVNSTNFLNQAANLGNDIVNINQRGIQLGTAAGIAGAISQSGTEDRQFIGNENQIAELYRQAQSLGRPAQTGLLGTTLKSIDPKLQGSIIAQQFDRNNNLQRENNRLAGSFRSQAAALQDADAQGFASTDFDNRFRRRADNEGVLGNVFGQVQGGIGNYFQQEALRPTFEQQQLQNNANLALGLAGNNANLANTLAGNNSQLPIQFAGIDQALQQNLLNSGINNATARNQFNQAGFSSLIDIFNLLNAQGNNFQPTGSGIV